MTTASDNKFPKVIVTEGAAPSSPSAGDFKLYVDSADHLFKMKNSAGTVTTFGTGLADPMTTRGDIIIRNSSNTTARLAVGGSGTVLSSDGTDVSWQTPAASGGGALVWLDRKTASGSATLDFEGFISSTYSVYEFVFTRIVSATDSVHVRMRFGTGAGPTYDTTSGNYSWDDFRIGPGGAAAGGSASSQDSCNITGGGGSEPINNTDAEGGWNARMLLYDPSGSAGSKHYSGQTGFQSGNTATYVIGMIGGRYIPTTAITAVRFFMSSGNITSGTIDLYGLTHA